MSETHEDPRLAGRAPPSEEGEPAPGELELVRSFINTRELDPDREELATPAALREWLHKRGIPVPGRLRGEDVERARRFREALRGVLLARDGEGDVGRALKELRESASGASLVPDVGPSGEVQLVPSCAGVDALVARVLETVARAQETGEWDRLKVCTSDECLWAFYDRSRNRSRHWCSMEVCGNRAKTRAYRRRHT